jgi:hypothetical protein
MLGAKYGGNPVIISLTLIKCFPFLEDCWKEVETAVSPYVCFICLNNSTSWRQNGFWQGTGVVVSNFFVATVSHILPSGTIEGATFDIWISGIKRAIGTVKKNYPGLDLAILHLDTDVLGRVLPPSFGEANAGTAYVITVPFSFLFDEIFGHI